jgi:hypothetical protein
VLTMPGCLFRSFDPNCASFRKRRTRCQLYSRLMLVQIHLLRLRNLGQDGLLAVPRWLGIVAQRPGTVPAASLLFLWWFAGQATRNT